MATYGGQTDQMSVAASNLATAQMNNMSETMRSFKDSLAFQFQTLNLTLQSLQNSVGNLSTVINNVTRAPSNAGLPANYLTASNPSTYLGSIPRNYAEISANSSYTAMNNPRVIPGNVGQLQWGLHSTYEAPYKNANMVAGMVGAGAISAIDMATNIGMLAFGGPAGMAAGMVGLHPAQLAANVIKPMVEDAIAHNKDVYTIQRMSPMIGDRFSVSQAQRAVKGIETLAKQDLFNSTTLEPQMGMNALREITSMGMQTGMFRGIDGDEDKLVKKVESASKVVKFLTGVMGNKDIQETLQMVKQLNDMGVNVFDDPLFAKKLGKQAFGYAQALGVSVGSLTSTAANMAIGSYGAAGHSAAVGIMPGIQTAATLSEMNKRQMLSPAQIAAAGGLQAIGQRMMGLEQRFIDSPAGMAMLFAGGNSKGGFDLTKLDASLGRGGFFGAVGQAAGNFFNSKKDMLGFMMNQENILAAAGKDGQLKDISNSMIKEMATRLNPYFDPNEDETTQVNAVAAFIKENMGEKEATSLAKAKEIMYPHLRNRVERSAKYETQLANVAALDKERGFSYATARFGRAIDRGKATIYEDYLNARDLVDNTTRYFTKNNLQSQLMKEGNYAKPVQLLQNMDSVISKASIDPNFKPIGSVNAAKVENAVDLVTNNTMWNSATAALSDFGVGVGQEYGKVRYNMINSIKDVVDAYDKKENITDVLAGMQNNNMLSRKSNMFKLSKDMRDSLNWGEPLNAITASKGVAKFIEDDYKTRGLDMYEEANKNAQDIMSQINSNKEASAAMKAIVSTMKENVKPDYTNGKVTQGYDGDIYKAKDKSIAVESWIQAGYQSGSGVTENIKKIAKSLGKSEREVMIAIGQNQTGVSQIDAVNAARMAAGSTQFSRLVGAGLGMEKAVPVSADLTPQGDYVTSVSDANLNLGQEALGIGTNFLGKLAENRDYANKDMAKDMQTYQNVLLLASQKDDVSGKAREDLLSEISSLIGLISSPELKAKAEDMVKNNSGKSIAKAVDLMSGDAQLGTQARQRRIKGDAQTFKVKNADGKYEEVSRGKAASIMTNNVLYNTNNSIKNKAINQVYGGLLDRGINVDYESLKQGLTTTDDNIVKLGLGKDRAITLNVANNIKSQIEKSGDTILQREWKSLTDRIQEDAKKQGKILDTNTITRLAATGLAERQIGKQESKEATNKANLDTVKSRVDGAVFDHNGKRMIAIWDFSRETPYSETAKAARDAYNESNSNVVEMLKMQNKIKDLENKNNKK